MILDKVDHIVYVCDHLPTGIEYIADLFGIAPEISGKHMAWGTHNALLSLGGECYFEVIAPDPDNPVEATIFDFQNKKEDLLLTWVYRPENIQFCYDQGHAIGVPFGKIQSGSRKKVNGSLLEWHISDLSITLADGVIPSLIDWKNSPHPAPHLPQGCTLKNLKAIHPDAKNIKAQMEKLEIAFDLEMGEMPRLIAEIETPKGIVRL
jgi:hypothetical protein